MLSQPLEVFDARPPAWGGAVQQGPSPGSGHLGWTMLPAAGGLGSTLCCSPGPLTEERTGSPAQALSAQSTFLAQAIGGKVMVPANSRAVLATPAAPQLASAPPTLANPALTVGLRAGSWFSARPAFAWIQDGETALSPYQSPLRLERCQFCPREAGPGMGPG